MNSKQDFFNLIWGTVYKAVFVSICCLLSVFVFAEDNQYQLKKLTQLGHLQNIPSQWLPLINHPNGSPQYFIANAVGQIYFFDNTEKLHSVLDLSTQHSKEAPSIRLTAVELHPNFASQGQLGSGTFYTAHIEVLDKTSRTKRLQERSSELKLEFDAVITEWQFNSDNYQELDLNTKREIVRIAVPDNTITIKQLSFNPYIKSWHEDFGLLHIALSGEKSWQKPLYSGVLLRINPARFGLRNFTVPNSNPYIKESTIQDEIFMLGGQNIKQFMWPDKNRDDILLSHRFKEKSLLSMITGHDDWRASEPEDIVYQRDEPIEGTLFYRGSNLPNLRNKLLLLTKEKQQWFIESLDIKPSINSKKLIETKPQQEW